MVPYILPQGEASGVPQCVAIGPQYIRITCSLADLLPSDEDRHTLKGTGKEQNPEKLLRQCAPQNALLSARGSIHEVHACQSMGTGYASGLLKASGFSWI